jgi:hypothetical protein
VKWGLCGWTKLQADEMELLWTVGDENGRKIT